MKTIYLSLLLAIVVSSSSCSSKNNETSFDSTQMDLTHSGYGSEALSAALETTNFSPPVTQEDAVEENSPAVVAKTNIKKKIIKDGNISVKTNDIVLSKKRIDAILLKGSSKNSFF